MTAQILDTILFGGDEYSLIGMTEGCVLASPDQFGMEPAEIHTACYRGFYAVYELTEEALYLRKLSLRTKNGKYRYIGEIKPKKEDNHAVYNGLSEVISFTGKIRIAKDFIRELSIGQGYQKPTAFKTVLDIFIEKGKIVEIRDRTAEVKRKRGAFKKRYEAIVFPQRIAEAYRFDVDSEIEEFNEEEINKMNDEFNLENEKILKEFQIKNCRDEGDKNETNNALTISLIFKNIFGKFFKNK